MKKKKIILIISIIAVLLLTIGVSLAAYTYTRVGSNQELVLGDIYMHYNETNELVLDNAMPYKLQASGYTLNSAIKNQTYEEDTRNELSKCVDYFSDTYYFDEGKDAESYCKGTGTMKETTFQSDIDNGMFGSSDEDYGYEFLTSNNIITSDNLVNPIMQNQTYEEDIRNELCKCVDYYQKAYNSTVSSDFSYENYCKGIEMLHPEVTLKDEIEMFEEDFTPEGKAYFLIENNIAVPNYSFNDMEYFEFTISGKNTYTEKDIWYDISLVYGDNHETRNTRIRDDLLKFTLVEIKDGVETTVVDNQSYSSIENKRIYVNIIEKNTTSEVNITYRLYMWISSDTVIGNVNQDYTIEEWEDVFASIKVKVNGDFTKKTADKPAILSPILKVEVSSYELTSASDFSGGLVAINHDGTLYDETDSQQEIREYRYTGLDVNNYIFLDTDGDSEQDENEMWRIVGIFKNSNDEWNLKLMRNTLLTADEIPSTYTYNGTSYKIRYNDTQSAYWNYNNTATNYNDWTTAKLQYWLNADDGYYGTLSNSIQNIIDTDYTYYLGNYTSSTVLSYTAERNASNIWSGNSSSWNGSVALLYPSDYGYSANSSYWSGTALYEYNTSAKSTSWMQQNANHTTSEWFLSPSGHSSIVAFWDESGYVKTKYVDHCIAVRPVINLIANFGSLSGSGTESDPYKLS